MNDDLRMYQGIWLRLVNNFDNTPEKKGVKLHIKPGNEAGYWKRIRKAVWKEKDLDKKNRSRFRCHCEHTIEADGKEYVYFHLSLAVGNPDNV